MSGVDVQGIRDRHPIDDVIGRAVDLKRSGRELRGLCPFHDERSPSFYVVPQKQMFHCFGCGARGDVIGFVMRFQAVDFRQACELLEGRYSALAAPRPRPVRSEPLPVAEGAWMPVMPAPLEAPALHAGVPCAPFNPNRGRPWQMTPTRADAYRDPTGRVLGYVLRVDFDEGGKATPQCVWGISPTGAQGWVLMAFPEPRPLMGLDALAEKPDAPVLVVEGEKCREAAAAALRGFAVVSWAGGSKAVGKTDWSPLRGRELLLWPDADEAGWAAMLGYVDDAGLVHDGVAQLAACAGATRIRIARVLDAGRPRGWDVYDALTVERWSAAQIVAWLRHVVDDVVLQPVDRRRA